MHVPSSSFPLLIDLIIIIVITTITTIIIIVIHDQMPILAAHTRVSSSTVYTDSGLGNFTNTN